jgi:class 3 adenylate cyclase
LAAEHERTEALLCNVLPTSIARRLKHSHHTIADDFPSASVLFADIVGFTSLAQSISPEEVVSILNRVFSRFDELVDDHGMEKIKTIGDAYMVAAGIPVPREDHADALARFALALRADVDSHNLITGSALQVRIGMNSGPVVAGVIGRRRFLYDLWGDTVNTAARMESHGVPGRIQVTEATRALLGNRYLLEERGVVDVKGKGPMRTFFLTAAATPAPVGALSGS